MARAETTISFIAGAQRAAQSGYIVQTPAGVIYSLFVAVMDNSLCWAKSTDGGFTWTDMIAVKSGVATSGSFSLWYDKWTPGNTGTLIHVAIFEQTTDDVIYRSLDTANDALGTEVVIFAGASTGAVGNTCISITRAIGGNLCCAFDIDGGTEVGFYKSTDAGANWSAMTDVNESASTDYYLLAPGFAVDTQDIICIFWDRSASEISRKLYDDSGNSWAESSIAASMTAVANTTAAPQFSLTVDDANNKILLIAWSAADAANADLRFWTIDESAITEGTAVVSNGTDDQGVCALALATDTATLYAYYVGKSDGTETFATSVNIYYKTSGDGGATWGAETQLSLAARGIDYLMTFLTFTGDFGLVFESQTAVFDMLAYSALLPSGGGGNANLLAGKL